MTRMPPRLPRPATRQRSFRSPPEPRTRSPASGFATSDSCNSKYSSSERYCPTSSVNSFVSTNVNTLRLYVTDVLHQRRRASAAFDQGRRALEEPAGIVVHAKEVCKEVMSLKVSRNRGITWEGWHVSGADRLRRVIRT